MNSIHGGKKSKETAQAITEDCNKVAHQDQKADEDLVAKTGECDKGYVTEPVFLRIVNLSRGTFSKFSW